MIGGQHRYAVDQYGGGRNDPHATATARLWWGACTAAAGLPMMFMGTEIAQSGWWDTDKWHSMQWPLAEVRCGTRVCFVCDTCITVSCFRTSGALHSLKQWNWMKRLWYRSVTVLTLSHCGQVLAPILCSRS